jgi:hypothetical protein
MTMTATINNVTNSASVTDHDDVITADPVDALRAEILTANTKGETVLSDSGRIVAITRDSFKTKIRQNVPWKLSDGKTVIMAVDKADGLDRMRDMANKLRKIADLIDAIPSAVESDPQVWGDVRSAVTATTAAPLGKNAGLLLL